MRLVEEGSEIFGHFCRLGNARHLIVIEYKKPERPWFSAF